MIEEKIPCFILNKGDKNALFLIQGNGKGNDFKTVNSEYLTGFNKGDYVFMHKITERGIVTNINYIKMNDTDIKKYFPDKSN